MKSIYIVLAVCWLAACGSQGSIPQKAPVTAFINEKNLDSDKFREPSGICYSTKLNTLFVVGDQGHVAQYSLDGTQLNHRFVGEYDFEGITIDDERGRLYLAVEGEEKVLQLDPESLRVTRRFEIERDYQGQTVMAEGGQGIEGITFVPRKTRGQADTLIVSNQSFTRAPGSDGSALITLQLPLEGDRSTKRLPVIRYEPMRVIDIAALHFDVQTGILFYGSDAESTLFRRMPNGDEHSWRLPSSAQEGIAFDHQGSFYLARDRGGIYSYDVTEQLVPRQ